MSEQAVDSKPRILMVDDSKVIRMAAIKILSKDFDVVVAIDGEDAWEVLLADNSIHVVFTDLMMPTLDGLGLLDRIRASDDPGMQKLPVIMVTGADNSDEIREKALEQGATDFLHKPFNSVDLKARASAHCNYQREAMTMKKQITVDALTGLINQKSFVEQLEKDLSYAGRHRQSVAIVIAELPAFKQFFLLHGKAAADGVLRYAAEQVRQCIRTEDTASRFGLPMFAISLPSTANEGAVKLLDRLQQTLNGKPFRINDQPVPVKWRFSIHTPDVAQNTNALTEVQAAIAKLGQPPVVPAAPAPAPAPAPAVSKPAPLSVDKALAMIASGHGDKLSGLMPRLLQEIMPLLQLASAEQRRDILKKVS